MNAVQTNRLSDTRESVVSVGPEPAPCSDGGALLRGLALLRGRLQALTLILLALASFQALAQTTPAFRITSASYVETNNVLSTLVPAGSNEANLLLAGTLPTAAQQSQTSLLACFYTGYGSTAGLPLSLPNSAIQEPLVVPASTITAISPANFTAANNYSVPAKV